MAFCAYVDRPVISALFAFSVESYIRLPLWCRRCRSPSACSSFRAFLWIGAHCYVWHYSSAPLSCSSWRILSRAASFIVGSLPQLTKTRIHDTRNNHAIPLLSLILLSPYRRLGVNKFRTFSRRIFQSKQPSPPAPPSTLGIQCFHSCCVP